MMFSIVGWLWETPWVSIRTKKYVNRGFLRGPYIPIYGFAVITIILSMDLLRDINDPSMWMVFLQIIYMGLVTAVWEFFTSLILEKTFHTRWWDYSNHRFNIQGRISLHVSMFFAVGGYVLWFYILPLFDTLYMSINPITMGIGLSAFYIVFMLDSYITLKDLFKLRDIILSLEKMSKEVGERLDASITEFKLQSKIRKDNIKETILELRKQLREQYNQLDESRIKIRVLKDLDKISDVLQLNKRISRFFDKYPNSFSKQLSRSKLMLKKISTRIKKKDLM